MAHHSCTVKMGTWPRAIVTTICMLIGSAALESSASPADADTAEKERLIIFVQPSESESAKAFDLRFLPSIRALANELSVPVSLVDVHEGAPAEVTSTPLLVYQNAMGRSYFQGRLTAMGRIRSFIRTSRIAPQADTPLTREDVGLWRTGRTKIAVKVKVAPVTGARPEGHNHDSFVEFAKEAVRRGWRRLRPVQSATLARSDRTLYMDFNPWLSPDGTLYLSVELYSQFHCKKPIFNRDGSPLIGIWGERSRIFAGAAKCLEEAVIELLSSADNGEGLDAVPSNIPVLSWEAMGLALPDSHDATPNITSRASLVRNWEFEANSSSEHNSLMFRFPAPLDGYSGEMRRFRGKLYFAQEAFLSGVTGRFDADPSSITMGEPDLDDALQGASYLHVQEYPTAFFEITKTAGEGTPLVYGMAAEADVNGTFTMKGVSIPLSFKATFEPLLGTKPSPNLEMKGVFTIPLSPFSIEGPDGPTQAANQLNFSFKFLLHPLPSTSSD